MKIIVVIAARNEEEWLGRTLRSLRAQSRPLDSIIVIDDGSTDNTYNVAMRYGCNVVSAPPHEESYIGDVKLAEVWNRGLELADSLDPDYVLISGADHVYPPDYVERLLAVMSDTVVVASGIIAGHPHPHGRSPRGSGRIVDVAYWRRISALRFPVSRAWESYIVSKVSDHGLSVKVVHDLVSHSRALTVTPRKMFGHGQGMRSLGYYPIHAVMRSARLAVISPKAAVAMMRGYLSYRGPFHDCAYTTWCSKRENAVRRIIYSIISGIRCRMRP